MKFRAMLSMALCSVGLAVQADVTVLNLVVVQRAGSKLVDITYDVHSTETNAVTVSLAINDGVLDIGATSLSGDVGEGISTGLGKSIVWDAGVDWDGNVAVLSYSLQADGRKFPCPVAKTGQTISYRLGDDGDLQKGIEWPTPHFIDNGDGTVVDNLTGLEWVKDPHSLSGNAFSMHWSNAVDYCASVNYAGHSDWRLPSRKELMSLIEYGNNSPSLVSGHPFIDVEYSYWSGTSATIPPDPDPDSAAWEVSMISGSVSYSSKTREFITAWPVRNRKILESPAPVPKTSQITSYRTGDDGDLEEGVAWPNPRFTDSGNGIVVDNLTGLQWVKSPHSLSGNSSWTDWNSAIDFCNSLSYAEHSDWRLPNVKELESLVNCGKGVWGDYPDEWLNSTETPFSGINGTYYSSTVYGNYTNFSRFVSMEYGGHVGHGSVAYANYYTWPVRGGLSSQETGNRISANSITDTSAVWTPDDELIAFYPFGGNADDDSGNGHDGAVIGAMLTTDRYGNSDSAYQFDGVDDYIVIPDHDDFTRTDVTVAAWVLTTDKSDYKHITSCYGNDVGSQWYNLYITSGSGTARWQVDSGGSSPFSVGTTDIADDSWHLIVGVRDTSTAQLKIYVDGVLGVVVPDSFTDVLDPNFDFWIGGQNEWPSRYFNGVIDDVRIYSRALSESEVKQLADSDLDQLSDSDEVNVYGTDPLVADSDNDGLSDSEELGIGNYCLRFDGINNYVSVEAAEATNTFTVEFWVNATEAHQIDQELNFGVDGVVGQKYALFPNPQGMGVSIGTNGISVYEHQANYMPPLVSWAGSVLGWTHVAVVYDDKTPSLYVNGYWVRTGLQSPKDTTTPSFKVGGGGYGYLKGKMDELRVWDHARSASELLNGMHAVLTGTESGLLRLYKFDHSSGSVLEDLAENANGTLYNMSDSDWCLSGVRFGTDPLNEDSDGDSIPDGWEVSNGLDAMGNDADTDKDGDTLSNLQEYIIGTDPQDIHSFTMLSATGEPRLPGTFDMECTTVTGRQYTVEYKNSLIEGNDWAIYTNFDGSGASIFVADKNVVSNRFFRVKVVKP